MKRLVSILILLAAFTASAADLVISNNAVIVGFGDSQDADGSGAPSTGYMRQAYIHSYFALNYPQYTLSIYDFGRSGGTMDDRLTNGLQSDGLACWGFQSNNFQHLGISFCTDNANLVSNAMYLAQSNMCLAPGMMSDGVFPLVTQTGWAATHPVQWIVAGSDPAATADGGDIGGTQSQRARDAGCTNAGINFGVAGISLFYPVVAGWTNDAATNNAAYVGIFKGTSKEGHIEAPGQLNMAIAFLQGITTDTNISTCTINFNGAFAAATNHCVISSVSRTGNTLTFNRLDDRLPMAWDISNTDPTNNATPAFTLIPSQADAFQFTLQVTNLPAGHYRVQIDGVTVADNMSSATLASGWNMFTNTFGPYWNQRYEVLGRIRDFEYVNRQTRVPGSAGDDTGEVSLGSQAFSQWTSAVRGDALIARIERQDRAFAHQLRLQLRCDSRRRATDESHLHRYTRRAHLCAVPSMKKFLASLAKRFRRFASHSSGNDQEPVSPPAFSGEHDGFDSRAGIASASIAPIPPSVSRHTNGLRSQQALSKPNEMQNARSVNPDFITRDELKREVDLLRRLIESRK